MNIFSSRGWFARACRAAIAVAALSLWFLAVKYFAYLQNPRRPGLWDYASAFVFATTAIVVCVVVLIFVALGVGYLFDWIMSGNDSDDEDDLDDDSDGPDDEDDLDELDDWDEDDDEDEPQDRL